MSYGKSSKMRYTLRQAVESDLEPMMRIGHEGIRPYVEQLWGWDQADQERRFRENFHVARISIVEAEGGVLETRCEGYERTDTSWKLFRPDQFTNSYRAEG